MKALTAITDPVYVEPQKFSRYEKFCLKYVNDKRDLPFVRLLTAIHLIVIPAAVMLYTPLLQNIYWWLAYIPYFYISQMYFKGRFGLMLHCISHRKLFRKEYNWLNIWIIWVVCPFFGHTPETYFVHHMGMHHVENNQENDASSTMKYQRDSLFNFIKYVARFLLLGIVDTFMYFFNRKRKKFYMRLSYGEGAFILFCVGMFFVNAKATLFLFVVPLIFSRMVMMVGNWAQHSFIDKNNPEDNFTSAITCINTGYNKMCWNDGYHTVHHLRPSMHYTDIPVEFMKLKNEFVQKKALIFDGIHYLHIFIYLMTKRYDKLADNLVNIDNTFSSKEEAIALMKERTKKIKLPA